VQILYLYVLLNLFIFSLLLLLIVLPIPFSTLWLILVLHLLLYYIGLVFLWRRYNINLLNFVVIDLQIVVGFLNNAVRTLLITFVFLYIFFFFYIHTVTVLNVDCSVLPLCTFNHCLNVIIARNCDIVIILVFVIQLQIRWQFAFKSFLDELQKFCVVV